MEQIFRFFDLQNSFVVVLIWHICVCACARFLSQSHYHHPSALGSAFPLPIFPFPILMPATQSEACLSFPLLFLSIVIILFTERYRLVRSFCQKFSFSPFLPSGYVFSSLISYLLSLFFRFYATFLPVSCIPTMYDNNCD